MYELQPHTVYCPYCGENLEVLIDTSEDEQDYIEDCQVCCRPIRFLVQIDNDGDAMVIVQDENDV